MPNNIYMIYATIYIYMYVCVYKYRYICITIYVYVFSRPVETGEAEGTADPQIFASVDFYQLTMIVTRIK